MTLEEARRLAAMESAILALADRMKDLEEAFDILERALKEIVLRRPPDPLQPGRIG